jgi:riboflavin synthase
VFTGLIRDMGRVSSLVSMAGGMRLEVAMETGGDRPLKVGDSVAVNGACLTVVEVAPGRAVMEVSPETLARTNLSDLKPGDVVNLEGALRLGDPLDGHLVLGHVDETVTLLQVKREGEFFVFRFSLTSHLAPYVAEKGSVALDGISLTVKEVLGDAFTVAIIPHTFHHTNLQYRRPGDRLNLEVDIIARYVERLMGGKKRALSEDLLKRAGFI